MIKCKYKKYIYSTIIIFVLSNMIKISANENITDFRMKLIIENLKPGIKYKVSEKMDLFKKIFVGSWDAPPHAEYIFYKNGTYVANNYEFGYTSKRGRWYINDNKLFLKLIDEKKWKTYEIDYFILSISYDEDRYRNKVIKTYYFDIELKDYIEWGYVGCFMLRFSIEN